MMLHPVACHAFYQNDLFVLVDIVLRHLADIDEASVVRPLVRAPPFARNSIVGLMSLCCVLLAAQLLAIVYGLVRNCELMSSEYDKKTALLDTVQAHLASPHHNNATLAVKIMRFC